RSASDDLARGAADCGLLLDSAGIDQAGRFVPGAGLRGAADLSPPPVAPAGTLRLWPDRGARGGGTDLDAIRRGSFGVQHHGLSVRLSDPALAGSSPVQ